MGSYIIQIVSINQAPALENPLLRPMPIFLQ